MTHEVSSCSHKFIPVNLISVPLDFEPGTWNFENLFPRKLSLEISVQFVELLKIPDSLVGGK